MVVVALLSVDLVESVDLVSVDLVVNYIVLFNFGEKLGTLRMIGKYTSRF